METTLDIPVAYYERTLEIADRRPLLSLGAVLEEARQDSAPKLWRIMSASSREEPAVPKVGDLSPTTFDWSTRSPTGYWPAWPDSREDVFILRLEEAWPAPAAELLKFAGALINALEQESLARFGISARVVFIDGTAGSGIFRAQVEGVAQNLLAGWIAEILKYSLLAIGGLAIGSWSHTKDLREACKTAVIDGNLRTIECRKPGGEILILDVSTFAKIDHEPGRIEGALSQEIVVHGVLNEDGMFSDSLSAATYPLRAISPLIRQPMPPGPYRARGSFKRDGYDPAWFQANEMTPTLFPTIEK